MAFKRAVGSWDERVNPSSRRFLKNGASDRYSHSEKKKGLRRADPDVPIRFFFPSFTTSLPKSQMSDNVVDPGGV